MKSASEIKSQWSQTRHVTRMIFQTPELGLIMRVDYWCIHFCTHHQDEGNYSDNQHIYQMHLSTPGMPWMLLGNLWSEICRKDQLFVSSAQQLTVSTLIWFCKNELQYFIDNRPWQWNIHWQDMINVSASAENNKFAIVSKSRKMYEKLGYFCVYTDLLGCPTWLYMTMTVSK